MPVETEVPAVVGDELEALIEEARRRARRRRLGYLALAVTALIVAGALFLLEGGGSSEQPAPLGQDGQPSPAAATAPGPSANADRCPAVDPVPIGEAPTNPVIGCRIRLAATLPAGWHQSGRGLTAFPPGMLGIVVGVQFASFPIGRRVLAPWPPPGIPSDGIAMMVESSRSLPGKKFHPTTVGPLAPDDFRIVANDPVHPLATTRLEAGGWRFVVQARVGSSGPSPELLDQANAVLASIRTDEHLCPCPGR